MAIPGLDTLKAYLRIEASNTEDDALLQALLDGAVDFVSQASGLRLRSFEAGGFVDAAASGQGRSLWFDPIPGYQSIQRWNDGAWEDVTADAQAAGLYEQRRRGGGFQFLVGLSTLDAGAFTFDPSYVWRIEIAKNADAVTELCATAILRIAAYAYHARDAQAFEVAYSPATGELTIPRGIPADALQMIQACKVFSL